MEMGGESYKRRRGCWAEMDSYRVVDKRARGGMWVCMVGMCRGWVEDGIEGWCAHHRQQVGEWRVAWRGRRVSPPHPLRKSILSLSIWLSLKSQHTDNQHPP